jgi:hypothetical protein
MKKKIILNKNCYKISISYIRTKSYTVCNTINKSWSILPIERMWTAITRGTDVINADLDISRDVCHRNLKSCHFIRYEHPIFIMQFVK